MNDKEEIKQLKSDLIGSKQIIEQLEVELSKKDKFVLDMFPIINNIEIKVGWYQSNNSIITHKVTIDVNSEDLHKLIRLLTNNGISKRRYNEICEEIKKELKL
jgi:hypothetical protein